MFQKLLRLLRKARGVGHDLRREHIGAPGFGHQPDNIQRLRERLRRRRRVIDLAGRARQVTVILLRPLGGEASILQQRAGGDGDIPDNAVCSGKNLAVIAILRPRIPPGLCHQQHAKYWNEWQFFQTVRHRTFQRHKTHQQRHAHRDARNRNAQRHIGRGRDTHGFDAAGCEQKIEHEIIEVEAEHLLQLVVGQQKDHGHHCQQEGGDGEQAGVVALAQKPGVQCHEQQHGCAQQDCLHQRSHQQKCTGVHTLGRGPGQKHEKDKRADQRQQDTAKWRNSDHGDTFLIRKKQ